MRASISMISQHTMLLSLTWYTTTSSSILTVRKQILTHHSTMFGMHSPRASTSICSSLHSTLVRRDSKLTKNKYPKSNYALRIFLLTKLEFRRTSYIGLTRACTCSSLNVVYFSNRFLHEIFHVAPINKRS